MTAPSIYLASRSPRRQQLLRQIGVDFEELRLREAPGRRRDVIEKSRPDERAEDYVRRIALAKADAMRRRMRARRLEPRPILSADTEVVKDGMIFGKPAHEHDAVRMLALLAGQTHLVLTAIALVWQERTLLALSTTKVTFQNLTAAQIERYVATGESFGKAGGYAIQGLAATFIRRIDGSYSGVMGLPLHETAEALAKIGFPVL